MSPSLNDDLANDLDTAFPKLIDAYGSMVVSLATRLTDASTGEDITQEVFLRAYRALGGYAKHRILDLDLRPWLATITRNLVRNEYRRRERRPTVAMPGPHQTDGAMVDPTDAADTALAALDIAEGHDRIQRLLAPLTEIQREAVVLRHVAGLPLREVALAIACPEGTTKSHLSRGLARIRNAAEQPTTEHEEER